MNILGLDLALGRSGFAVVAYETGALLATGVIDPPTLALDKRLSLIADGCAEACTESVSNVFIESPIAYRSGTTTIRLGMVHGAVLTRLSGGPPVNSVNVSQLKKWATGHGNASKEMMIAAAAERFGVWLSNDEADAALVAAWGRQLIEESIAEHPSGGAA